MRFFMESKHLNQVGEKKEKISSLYLLKAIAAFVVVSCHSPFGIIKNDVQPIQCIAVVIFFMISGYFLYATDRTKIIKRLKSSIFKVVKITVVVQAFYLLWLYPNNGFMLKSWSDFNLMFFQGGLTSGHLWYLTAFWQALVIFLLFFCLSKTDKFMRYIPLLILLLPLFSFYNFLLPSELPQINIYNVFFYGLPSIAIGYLIRKNEAKLLNFKSWGLLASVFLLLGFLEKFLLSHYLGVSCTNGILFSSPFLAIFLFLFFLQKKDWGTGSFVEEIGAKHSANIYYFHIAILTVCMKVCYALSLGFLMDNFGVVLCFVASLFFSMLFVRIERFFSWKILS